MDSYSQSQKPGRCASRRERGSGLITVFRFSFLLSSLQLPSKAPNNVSIDMLAGEGEESNNSLVFPNGRKKGDALISLPFSPFLYGFFCFLPYSRLPAVKKSKGGGGRGQICFFRPLTTVWENGNIVQYFAISLSSVRIIARGWLVLFGCGFGRSAPPPQNFFPLFRFCHYTLSEGRGRGDFKYLIWIIGGCGVQGQGESTEVHQGGGQSIFFACSKGDHQMLRRGGAKGGGFS